MAMSYLHRLQSLGRKGPSAWLQVGLARIPGQPIKTEQFLRYQLDGYPDARRGSVQANRRIRLAWTDDIEALVGCMDKRALFLRRLALGDYCLAAFDNNGVIGYEWFSARPEHIEERYWYRFDIPPNALYAYDAFIAAPFRGHGVWRELIREAAGIMREEKRRCLITHIDHKNAASIAAHCKFGFRCTGIYRYTEFFGKQFLRESPVVN